MQFFEVGKCYEGFRTFQDGYRLELTDDGLILYACMRGVTSEEKREFQSSKPFHMCYKIFGDVCFVCFKFGRLEWSDCPFAPGLYPAHNKHPQLPDFSVSDALGFGLHIFLADSVTGELFAIRQIGLGHEFSTQWCEWVAKYLKIPMSDEVYNEKIDEVYNLYSTEDLAKMGRFNSYRL